MGRGHRKADSKPRGGGGGGGGGGIRKRPHKPNKPSKKPHPTPSRKPSNTGSAAAPAAKKEAKADPYDQTATIPFDFTHDSILLVGDGDLSFTHALAAHHFPCSLTSSVLDSEAALLEKHPQSAALLAAIRAEDAAIAVHFSIDATKLDTYKVLSRGGRGFDRVVFNFPHVGGRSTDVNRQVRANQELLVGFFGAAQGVLARRGTVVVTLFEGEPYSLWNVRDLARHAGLEVQRSFGFDAGLYPGYGHVRTLGNVRGGGGWRGEDREARTFVFWRKGEGARRERRRRDGSEDEDDD